MARAKNQTTTKGPVLALIEAHRVAVSDWYKVSKELWQLAPKLPHGPAGAMPAEELFNRLQDVGKAEQRALHDLLDCRPATMEGAHGLIGYLGDVIREREPRARCDLATVGPRGDDGTPRYPRSSSSG